MNLKITLTSETKNIKKMIENKAKTINKTPWKNSKANLNWKYNKLELKVTTNKVITYSVHKLRGTKYQKELLSYNNTIVVQLGEQIITTNLKT